MTDPTTTGTAGTCRQIECTFGEDGACLEGLPDPLQCPHFGSLSNPNGEVVVNSSEPSSGVESEVVDDEVIDDDVSIENWLPLSAGYELSVTTASRITRAQAATLVVLAGEPDAGKTTLIASIYEMFSEGPYASFRFAGSETLLAFERACHLSRTSSGAEKADTERTKGLHPRFFHLALQALEDESDQHLLLTDISGEAYRRATNHSDDAKKLSFIRRADAFVLLLDGERLADKSERQEVFRRGLLLLRSLTEGGVLNKQSSVTVAISKFDLLQPGLVDENTLEFVRYVKTDFARFGVVNYERFSIVEIASRPLLSAGLPYAYGLDKLLKGWFEREPIVSSPPYFKSMESPSSGREADLFLWKHFAG